MEMDTNWISAKDRTPLDYYVVLVHWTFKRHDGYIYSGYGDGWCVCGKWEAVHPTGAGDYEFSDCDVDYWMPIPPLPTKIKQNSGQEIL